MNIYYYTFHVFYEISLALKKDRPEWYANLGLTLLLVFNSIEINYFISIFKYGQYVKLGQLALIFFCVLLFIINYLVIIRTERYLTFKKKFSELQGAKKTLLNFIEIIYIVITIVLLFIK